MTFTSPTGEIGLQGALPLSFKCSGTIEAGQGVYIVADMEVKAGKAAISNKKELVSGCIGVAEAKQTDGDWIAIYGPGSVVNVIISGSNNCSFGETLHCTTEGKFAHTANVSGTPSGVSAIALEDQQTANGTCRVLLI